MTPRQTSDRTFIAGALLSFVLTISVSAQPTEWKEHVSDRGKFSVSLPGDLAIRHRVSVQGYSIVEIFEMGAKTWEVNYFDLPAIPPNAAAVKKLLGRRSSRGPIKPGSEKSLTVSGYPALEVKSPIDDRNEVWITRIILVKQRVYELRLNTRVKQTASEEVKKFFDSFKPLPMTEEEIAAATQGARDKADSRKLTLSSEVLLHLAVKKIRPVYPPEARAAGVIGAVKIRVLVSEEGNVIKAEVVEGPDLLRESALAAARMWVFKPTDLGGMPVRVGGLLIFNFTLR
jgi:TonB family protein